MEQNNYASKKEAKQEAAAIREKKDSVRATLKMIFSVALISALGGLLIWYIASGPKTPQSDILATNGLHWHARLVILIDGKEQNIPEDIGIGIRHENMHTHDTTGEIHMEMSGLVKKDDTKLGGFFEIWGKKFSSSCVLDVCAKDGKTVKLLVNDTHNDEFENYHMQDKDRIEIRYE